MFQPSFWWCRISQASTLVTQLLINWIHWASLGHLQDWGKTRNTGWWFGTWILFSHILGSSSSQLMNSYFSEGLKPPTSYIKNAGNCEHPNCRGECSIHFCSYLGWIIQEAMDLERKSKVSSVILQQRAVLRWFFVHVVEDCVLNMFETQASQNSF